ncbi:hypothetical protein [Rickettsiella endosymbiont of Rhagonycha lignosa]|uniref:hypothetical protein n=1 Tax=Rickettsiella endosymbiont of Rhagonycha lignosa TaxID=3077937 RepID=UPI00313B93A5
MLIDNKNDLWTFMSDNINSQSEEYCRDSYTQENFLKDYVRSLKELCINGELAESILLNATNQIEVIHAITVASAILEENPEHIKQAYREMIPKDKDTDQFKTTLESVASMIKKLDGMEDIAKALRTLASNLNSVAGDGSKTHYPLFEGNSISESFSQTLLSAGSLLREKKGQIEKTLLVEAANVTFNKIDVNQSECNLGEYRKQCFRSFLKLFLHQRFIYPSINFINVQDNVLFLSPKKRTIDLSYLDDSLLIKVSFSIQTIYDEKTNKPLEVAEDDYFVKGVATYKIDIKPYNLSGWIAGVELMDSVLECKPEYKNILDTKSILEKFQQYLVALLEKLNVYLNLADSLNSNKTRCKSFFFVSPDGNSAVTKQIFDNDPDNSGEISNIIINGMSQY